MESAARALPPHHVPPLRKEPSRLVEPVLPEVEDGGGKDGVRPRCERLIEMLE